MNKFRLIISVLMMVPFVACNSQQGNKQAESADGNSDKIEAYYFHFTARCMTCNTIEAKAKENLQTLYPNQFNQGLITFQSLNLEESVNKPLADRLGVSGQTLLIVKGDKKVNLTNEGFLYAVAKPEKFREIINEKVDGLLAQ